MAITLNDNIKIQAPKHTDDRYLRPDNTPYVDVADVNATLVSSRRALYLTVNIAGVEYWYVGGIADINLVIKSAIGVSSTKEFNIVGDNTTTVFTFTHNFNNRFQSVDVIKDSDSKRVSDPDVTCNANTTVITFFLPPLTGENYLVVVSAIQK